MSIHARFSPSSAYRRLNCTPSLLLEEKFQEEQSPYAAEGTAGHELGEYHIKKYLNIQSKEPTSNYYTDELVDAVNEYVSYVIGEIEEARKICKSSLFSVEQRIDASSYVEQCFGTVDMVIVTNKIANIIDLKLGGTPVYAENNSQLMIYGLGILEMFEHLYDVETVRMTIFQPRLNNISTFEISTNELKHWGRTVLKPKAAMALNGTGDFNPGSWCRFCKARNQCRARADQFLELAKLEFREPELLTDEEITEVLKISDELSNWASDVYSFAQEQAINHGKSWNGFKLVEGRSNRKYTSDDEVTKAASDAGYTNIYKSSIVSITEMEKLMGKQEFKKILGHLIYKPQGKITLVPESDNREKINKNTAAAEFQEDL